MKGHITVFDGHNDVLLDLLLPERGGGRGFFGRTKQGHLDLPRALEGGFGGSFFACFVPTDPADGWTLPGTVVSSSQRASSRNASARSFRSRMTMMTFMTVKCRGYLDSI